MTVPVEDRGRNRWAWPALLALTLFIASGQSEVATPGWTNLDKLLHALVFGLLATLVARTQPPRRYWIGIVAASAYGLLDELRQSTTPGRVVELGDWVADTAGAILAVGLYAGWVGYRQLLEVELWPRTER